MTNGPAERSGTSSTPLRASLAVVVLLATVGGFAAGFGVMTGWIGQGVLLLAGVVLAVVAARRRRPDGVRVAALLLGPLSVALFAGTTALAVGSY